MGYTRQILEFVVNVYDGSDDNEVVEELRQVMLDAGNEFIRSKPEVFRDEVY